MSSTKRGAVRAAGDFYETPAASALPVMRELAELWEDAMRLAPRPPHILDAGAGRGALTRAARAAFGGGALITAVELQDDLLPARNLEIRESARTLQLLEEGRSPFDSMLKAAGADMAICADYLALGNIAAGHGDRRWDGVDIVVSNPPFEIARDFITHTIDDLQPSVAAFLLRLNFFGSQDRREWLRAHPPDALRTLSDRPRFDGPRECAAKDCTEVWDRLPTSRSCPACGKRDGGDSIEYAWMLWTADGPLRAALRERHVIGWY